MLTSVDTLSTHDLHVPSYLVSGVLTGTDDTAGAVTDGVAVGTTGTATGQVTGKVTGKATGTATVGFAAGVAGAWAAGADGLVIGAGGAGAAGAKPVTGAVTEMVGASTD